MRKKKPRNGHGTVTDRSPAIQAQVRPAGRHDIRPGPDRARPAHPPGCACQPPMPGTAEASTSEALARITTTDTTSASAANATASRKAVEMPWASTLPAYGAGSWPVWANWARSCGVASAKKRATWVFASFLLAVPNTVTRIDRPREPPTCCMTLSRLDAAPDSRRSTPETATIVSGTNSRPIPNPNTSIGPRIPSTYPLVTDTCASQASPRAASTEPVNMRRLGPTLGSDHEANCEVTISAPVTGRNATPARSGL